MKNVVVEPVKINIEWYWENLIKNKRRLQWREKRGDGMDADGHIYIDVSSYTKRTYTLFLLSVVIKHAKKVDKIFLVYWELSVCVWYMQVITPFNSKLEREKVGKR